MNQVLTELLLLMAVILPVGIHFVLAFAAAGIPFITAGCALPATKRTKAFRNKYGQQASKLAFILGVYVFFVLLGGFLLLQQKYPESVNFWQKTPIPLIVFGSAFILAEIFFLLYRGVWKRMKNFKRLHAMIGFLSVLLFWAGLYVCLAGFRHFILYASEPTLDPMLFFIPPKQSMIWYLLPLTLSLTLTTGSAMSGFYLVLRRNRDDYGRDFYAFAYKLVARWGWATNLVTLLCLAAIAYVQRIYVPALPAAFPILVSTGVFAAMLLLSVLLWFVLVFSNAPLRQRFVLLLQPLFSMIGLTGLLTACYLLFLR